MSGTPEAYISFVMQHPLDKTRRYYLSEQLAQRPRPYPFHSYHADQQDCLTPPVYSSTTSRQSPAKSIYSWSAA